MAWKPSSVLREALLAGKRREEDDALVARYMAGPGRGHDPAPLVSFVRHVRADLGPRATICDVEIRGDPRNVREWVVWYFFPGDPAPSPAAAPNVNDVPNRASNGTLGTLRADAPGAGPLGPVQVGSAPPGQPGGGAGAPGAPGRPFSGAVAGQAFGAGSSGRQAVQGFGAEAGHASAGRAGEALGEVAAGEAFQMEAGQALRGEAAQAFRGEAVQAFRGTAAQDMLTGREALSRPLRPTLPTAGSPLRPAMPMQPMREQRGTAPVHPAMPSEEQGIAASWEPARSAGARPERAPHRPGGETPT